MKKFRRVEVEWVDAASDRTGWQPIAGEHAAKPVRVVIHTIGYVIVRNAEHIQLAQSVSEDGDQSAERITIPAGVIVRVRRAGRL
jgi:hypothetical protein